MKKTLKKIFKSIFISFLLFLICLINGPTSVLASSVSDSYADSTKINTGSSSGYTVTGGQLKMSNNDATGGTITYSGGYTIHTFTSGGTFTPNFTGNVDIQTLGGGGGGSNGGNFGGGGGAGQVSTSTVAVTSGTAYSITIGGGGGAQTAGNPTTVIGGAVNISAAGGGTSTTLTGATSGNSFAGGSGTNSGSNIGGGGGGGSTAIGGPSTATNVGGTGGAGTTMYDGVTRAGGGGGAGGTTTGIGTAGGGNGGYNSTGHLNGITGTPNYGGGGGGAVNATAGSGGSGIVIIRYPTTIRTSATIVSTNLLTGLTGVDGIDEFTYDLSSLPANTTATVQFSQDLTGPTIATGGTVTNSGGYTTHTFTSNGTFTANQAMNVEVLVVAGGGGGGYIGGGGGGGMISNASFAVAPEPITVTVGAGGIGQNNGQGGNGGNSIFSTLNAVGGGGGGYTGANVGNGGSGGGGGGGTGVWGTGTTGQGYRGGQGSWTTGFYAGGGGGGAGAVGSNASAAYVSGAGGNGLNSSISGASVGYAGGGSGGAGDASGTIGSGGGANFGGGRGAKNGSPGTSGTINTGGGGGGCQNLGVNNGGSGIVIVRYPNPGNWYNSSGVLGGTDSLTIGSNTLTIHNLTWSGSNFYYKVVFGSDGSATPTLDNIGVNYTAAGYVNTSATGTDNYADSSKINTSASSNYLSMDNQLTIIGNNQTAVSRWAMDETSGTSVADSVGSNTGTAYGPVTTAYWKMDEASGNALDSSGNNYTGTPVGTTVVAGKYGTARSFGGTSSDYISTSLDYSRASNQGFTMEAWINVSSLADYRPILGKATANWEWNFEVTTAGNVIFMYFTSAGGYGETVGGVAGPGVGPTTITTGGWHHVAVSYNGTTGNVYVDGVPGATFTGTGTWQDRATNVCIGCSGYELYTGLAKYFAGQIDDVRMYSTALNQTSIQNDMNNSVYAGTSITAGKYGTARNFNGASDYVEVLNNSSLQFTTAFTFDAWVYRNTDSGTYERILDKSGLDGYDYWMQISNDDTFNCGFTKADATTYSRITSATIPIGQWTHVSCSFDSTNGFNMYINGALSNGTAAGTIGTVRTSTRNFEIGRLGSGSVWYYGLNGIIDDVRVYNTVLTQAQINSDMNNTGPIATSATVVSTNLLSGVTSAVKSIDSFTYNLSSLPENTTAAVSFSQDGANWYSSGGVAGGTDSLTSGTHTIPITTLGWSGAYFYYKLAYTSDGSATPIMASVTVNYTTSTTTASSTWAVCTPLPGKAWTIGTNCFFPKTGNNLPYKNIDGVDDGNLTVDAYKTLTVKGDQILVRNSGKQINVNGTIVINDIPIGGVGGNVRDYSGNNNEGQAVGSTVVAGKYDKARYFNGTSNYINIDALNNGTSVKTVEFWINPVSNAGEIIDLNGTNYINATGGTLSAASFDNPTIYVNGAASTTLTAGQWQHVAVTTATGINASAVNIGKRGSSYFNGSLDDVRIYDYVRSETQITEDKDYVPSPTGNLMIAWYRFEDGGQIKETNLWSKDVDGDGWTQTLETQDKAQTDTPGTGWVRRKDIVGSVFGTGKDGNVTFTTNTNLSTWVNSGAGKSCAYGVSYNISSFGSTTLPNGDPATTAVLSSAPAFADCLTSGDNVLILNAQGTTSAYGNAGNYELLKIYSVSGSTITFTSVKKKNYGDGADDTNLGTATTNQRVVMQRVPQFQNATINSGVTVNADVWNGVKGGIVAFMTSETLTNNGTISASALGFRGGTGGNPGSAGYGGETYNGYASKGGGGSNNGGDGGGGGGIRSEGYFAQAGTVGGAGGGGACCYRAGGAGGYSTVGNGGTGANCSVCSTYGNSNGQPGSGSTGGSGGGYCGCGNAGGGGGGGGTYGSTLDQKLIFGSGGGGDAGSTSAEGLYGNAGGKGGGIVFVSAGTFINNSSILSLGANGGGGGAGGSIKLYAKTLTMGTTTGTGGAGGAQAGTGRIAAGAESITAGTSNPAYQTITEP